MFGINLFKTIPNFVNTTTIRSLKYDKAIRVMRGLNQPVSVFKETIKDINKIPNREEEIWREQRSLFKIDAKGPLPWRKKNSPIDHCPQMSGLVLKTLIKKPKKPNSANRKCVYVRLSNGKEATCFVPGIGHNLQEHSKVLVREHRVGDVPGLKLRVIRGVYDCSPIIKQTKS